LFAAKITSAKIKKAPAKKECIKFCYKFTDTIHFYISIQLLDLKNPFD